MSSVTEAVIKTSSYVHDISALETVQTICLVLITICIIIIAVNSCFK